MKKYTLLLFFGLTISLNAQLVKLNVINVPQDRNNWCAAAAAECVLDFKGVRKKHCQIMEYVRNLKDVYGGNNYGGYDCCWEIPYTPPDKHTCNKGIFLGAFGTSPNPGSVKDVLSKFGKLYSIVAPFYMFAPDIEAYLSINCLIIAQWDLGGFDVHVVVIHGIENKNHIYYMDPTPWPDGGLRDMSYKDFVLKEGVHKWNGFLVLQNCNRDYPCHCYNGEPDGDEQGVDCGGSCPDCATSCTPSHCCNGKFEPELGEFGFDCGGTCPNECPPPPTDKCYNCQQDLGEEYIDCGGDECSPCDDVPKEKLITSTDQLRPEVMALKKITAKGATTVASGKKVSFITEGNGSVVLLPGFKAEKGCTFTTQRWVDLSGFGRECGTICKLDYVSQHVVVPDFLKIYKLINAVEVAYYIYDKASTNRVYENHITITSNNEVYILWDCVVNGGYPAGTVWYIIEYYVYCCDGTYYKKRQEFSVNYFPYKSSNDDIEVPDNPENPDAPETQLSPLVNSIINQEENTVPALSIIPNPNGGTFQLETNFPLTAIESLKITNMLGVPVYESQNVTSPTIQLTGLAAGQYFVVVLLKDGTLLTQKLMLQK